jgi:hypothetical protein
VEIVQRDPDESVLIAAVGALLDVFEANGAAVPTRSMRDATRAVIAALGRASWRADLAMLPFLEQHRTAEAVPALIDLLARYREQPQSIAAGKMSGTLRADAYELLVDLTGALFPADNLEEWRAFWEKTGSKLAVAPRKEADSGGSSVATGFFGIQVVGTRVVFIIDVSLSMLEPYPVAQTTAGPRRSSGISKLDVAKRELQAAIDGLPPEAHFNVVVFYDDVQTWKQSLQPATVAAKKGAVRFIRQLEGRPATDVWGGLSTGLSMRSLVYGDRYDSNVDEIFLLSDGWPTAGEILDPGQILVTVDETNRFSKVRINTVFVGTTGDEVMHARFGWQPEGWMPPEEMMAKLAAHNGGRYVQPR